MCLSTKTCYTYHSVNIMRNAVPNCTTVDPFLFNPPSTYKVHTFVIPDYSDFREKIPVSRLIDAGPPISRGQVSGNF